MRKFFLGLAHIYWGICLVGIGVVFLLQERIPAAPLSLFGLAWIAVAIMAATAVDRWVVARRKKKELSAP